ncbi:MAG: hypothetical protein AAB254_08375, partial [candidate division NC10 bacterium]
MTILPLAEVPMADDAVARAGERLRTAARRRRVAVPPALLQALAERRPIPEWDAFLPYFVPDLVTLHAHLPPDAIIVWDEPLALADRAAAVLEEAAQEPGCPPAIAPLLPPVEERWVAWEECRVPESQAMKAIV